ncbi:MAG: hypothetical protein U9Q06_02495 [Nanoarchaeota archaeon]|nr:hypothetical protein [Nanoarchaeota archaeon]
MSAISDAVNQLFQKTIVEGLNYISGVLPEPYKTYINLGLVLIGITIYSIFVWNFYRFLAKRDLLELNLGQYNKTDNPGFYKFLAILLFTIEYIIILPIVVFFWFFVMAMLIFILATDLQGTPGTVLFISSAIIGAIRITAYYNEDLSKDLAKMFPFTILAIALVTPGFLEISTLQGVGQIGSLMSNIFVYLIVIIVLEFILRMLFFASGGGRTDCNDSEE